ncbi:MAG: hypothetical protein GY719_17830 [bacterium]|nr:hypothetical protein [bacterium]
MIRLRILLPTAVTLLLVWAVEPAIAGVNEWTAQGPYGGSPHRHPSTHRSGGC